MTKRTLFSIHFQILSKKLGFNRLKYKIITAILAAKFDHYAEISVYGGINGNESELDIPRLLRESYFKGDMQEKGSCGGHAKTDSSTLRRIERRCSVLK